MITVDIRFRQLLERRIASLVEEARDKLEAGLQEKEYLQQVGFLRALRMLSEEDGLLDEIETEILEGR